MSNIKKLSLIAKWRKRAQYYAKNGIQGRLSIPVGECADEAAEHSYWVTAPGFSAAARREIEHRCAGPVVAPQPEYGGGFDRTASHSVGEYVEFPPQPEAVHVAPIEHRTVMQSRGGDAPEPEDALADQCEALARDLVSLGMFDYAREPVVLRKAAAALRAVSQPTLTDDELRLDLEKMQRQGCLFVYGSGASTVGVSIERLLKALSA